MLEDIKSIPFTIWARFLDDPTCVSLEILGCWAAVTWVRRNNKKVLIEQQIYELCNLYKVLADFENDYIIWDREKRFVFWWYSQDKQNMLSSIENEDKRELEQEKLHKNPYEVRNYCAKFKEISKPIYDAIAIANMVNSPKLEKTMSDLKNHLEKISKNIFASVTYENDPALQERKKENILFSVQSKDETLILVSYVKDMLDDLVHKKNLLKKIWRKLKNTQSLPFLDTRSTYSDSPFDYLLV